MTKERGPELLLDMLLLTLALFCSAQAEILTLVSGTDPTATMFNTVQEEQNKEESFQERLAVPEEPVMTLSNLSQPHGTTARLSRFGV